MITNIITSVFICFFIATLLYGCFKVSYNLKQNKPTYFLIWLNPAIFAALAWFVYHF